MKKSHFHYLTLASMTRLSGVTTSSGNTTRSKKKDNTMKGTNRPPLHSGLTYHIFNQGNNRENIFKEEKSYDYFLRKYREFISPIANTYAYCLLPNHFHLLIQFKNYAMLNKFKPRYFPTPPKGIKNKNSVSNHEQFEYDKIISKKISRQLANFFGGYAETINNAYNRKGKLFSMPFKRIIVDNETYFEWLICYIHRNPIHHGFCDDLEIWKHSSYQEISDYMKTSGVTTWSGNTTDDSTKNHICNLRFLAEWFGNYDHFKNLHQTSVKAFLDQKYWLE